MRVATISPVLRFSGSGPNGKTTVVIYTASSPKDMRLERLETPEKEPVPPPVMVLGRANTPNQFAALMSQHQPDVVLLGSRIDEDPVTLPEGAAKDEDSDDLVMQDHSSFHQLKAWAESAKPNSLPGVVAMTCKRFWGPETQPFAKVTTVDMSSSFDKIVRAIAGVDPTSSQPPQAE